VLRNRIVGEVAGSGLQRSVLIAILDRREPPCAVRADGAADRPAKLLAIKGRGGQTAIEGGGEGLQISVAFEEKRRAMVVVRSAFGHDIHDAVAGAANFRGEASGGDLKLLNRILGEVRERAADDFVVVVAAIDCDIAAAAKAAAGADFKRVGLGRIERGRGAIAGNEIGEFEKVPAIQGNASRSSRK
jgi:hypothetical protein